ncbi:MAG: RHS repeat-associated core domain-containing protein [Planctomycetota bacterium]
MTTLGSGVDGAIRRLSTTFEARGLPLTLSSYDNASVTAGTLVNQVRFAYNAFSQLVSDSQSHGGPVIASSTPQVSLSYADGSGNTIRPTALTYPDGRVLSYDYGTADGINDAVSRVGSLIDDDLEESPLVEYSYLGLTSPVIVNYPEPDVKYTLASLTGANDPDTGDLYSGVDRFGRVKDARWYSSSSTADVARLQYGYDRASNRIWRADLVAQSLGKDFDELYGYDGLQRLQEMQRGELNSGHTSISSQNFAQCWRLDSTSNWQEFKEAASGTTLTLAQERHSNTVNEITSITRTVGSFWATPNYDAAGNTTTIPKPDNPAAVYGGTYDAWNRLVKLNIPGTSETVQEHQYDARNFRTVRKNYSSGTLSETRHFYYTPGWQVLEERLGTTPDSAAPDRHFVWGLRYIDDLVLRERDTDLDGRLDERLYSLQDANWNVVALINPSGAAEERYQYTPFGTPIILTGSMSAVRSSSAVGMEVLFTGQRFEELTKLHLFRMRWFDSLTGRFIGRDPLGYPDGMNAYAGWFVPGGVDLLGLEITVHPDQIAWMQRRMADLFKGGIKNTYISKILANANYGCVGYVMGDLGIPFNDFKEKPDLSRCFDSLRDAHVFAQTAKCPGQNSSGAARSPRILSVMFNDTYYNNRTGSPELRITFSKVKGQQYYDLFAPDPNDAIPVGHTFDPYHLLSMGGTGWEKPERGPRNHFYNYDFALLTRNNTWIHAEAWGQPPIYSTEDDLTDEFRRMSSIEVSPELVTSNALQYAFNKRFFCVLCEREFKDGSPVYRYDSFGVRVYGGETAAR